MPLGMPVELVSPNAPFTGGATSEGAFFELRFVPDVALVSAVRCFVTDFYGHLSGEPDVAHRLAMATHELLENAVAHSPDQRTEVRIVVRRTGPTMSIAIETRNRVSADRVAHVRRALDEVVSAADPQVLYQELMRRAAKRRDGGSGLGLGRIRAEAELTIAYEIERGEMLILTATGSFRASSALGSLEKT